MSDEEAPRIQEETPRIQEETPWIQDTMSRNSTTFKSMRTTMVSKMTETAKHSVSKTVTATIKAYSQLRIEDARREFSSPEMHRPARVGWIDEEPESQCCFDPSNLYWQGFVGLSIFADLVALIVDLTADLEDSQHIQYVPISVLVILTTDFIARCVNQSDKTIYALFDLFVLALTAVDVILSAKVPLAVVRFLRPARLLRPLRALKKFTGRFFESAADTALDRILTHLLGDVLYLTPSRINFSPAEGLLSVDKAHLLTEMFKGTTLPYQLKGGFVERLYVDMDLKRKSRKDGRRCVLVLSNVLIVLGPSDLRLDRDSWDSSDFVSKKNQLVEAIISRTERLVGKPKPKKAKRSSNGQEQPVPATMLGKIAKNLQKGLLGRINLSNVSVDLQNCEIRVEDFENLPEPVCAGFRVGNCQFRLVSSHNNGPLVTTSFRPQSRWSHQADPDEDDVFGGVPSDGHPPPARPNLWSSLVADPTDGFRDCGSHNPADWRKKKENPPVRIALSCTPVLAWWDINVTRQQCYTQYFNEEDLRISAAARRFRIEHLREQLKVATMAILHKTKRGHRNRALHHFEERILPHSCVLMPLTFSFHALAMPQNEDSTQGADAGPEQCLDIQIPWLQIMLDRQQLASIRRLERYLMEWMTMERKFSRKPIKRPGERFQARLSGASHHAAVHEYLSESQARSWWFYATQEIAEAIAPHGSLLAYLELHQRSKCRLLYSEMLFERAAPPHNQTDTKKKLKRTTSTLTSAGAWAHAWNQELAHVQASMSMTDIIDERHKVRRRLLAGHNVEDEDEGKPTAQEQRVDVGKLNETVKGRAFIAHIRVGLLEGRDDSARCAIRKPMVYVNVHHALMDWTFSAPEKEWDRLSTITASSLSEQEASGRVAVPVWIGSYALGPRDRYGAMMPGWFGLDATIDSFVVIHTQAPTSCPSLRYMLAPQVPMDNTAAPVSEGQHRDRMLTVQIVRWTEDAHVQSKSMPSTGTLVAYVCDLKLVEYQPLLNSILLSLRTAPLRFKDDPLRMGLVRDYLIQRRSGKAADKANIKSFERRTGLKLESGNKVATTTKEDLRRHPVHGLSAWRLFFSVGDIRVKLVSPYTERYFLLAQFFIPRSTKLFKRMAWPAFLGGEEVCEQNRSVSTDFGLEDMSPWVPRSKKLSANFHNGFDAIQSPEFPKPPEEEPFSLFGVLTKGVQCLNAKRACSAEESSETSSTATKPLERPFQSQIVRSVGVTPVPSSACCCLRLRGGASHGRAQLGLSPLPLSSPLDAEACDCRDTNMIQDSCAGMPQFRGKPITAVRIKVVLPDELEEALSEDFIVAL